MNFDIVNGNSHGKLDHILKTYSGSSQPRDAIDRGYRHFFQENFRTIGRSKNSFVFQFVSLKDADDVSNTIHAQ